MTELIRCFAARGESQPGWICLGVALLLLASGCAAPAVSLSSPIWPNPRMAAPTLTLASITAPVDRQGRYELAQIGEMLQLPAARLRQAYIWQSQGKTDRSISALNQILFGNDDYGPAVESYAYFLRAEAYQNQHKVERAASDRQQATELAIDASLRQRLAALTIPAKPKVSITRPKTAKLEIIARSAWSPQPPIENRLRPMGRVYRITIHHTAMLAAEGPRRETQSLLRRIQRQHQRERKWGDIGYHFVIDQNGRIWTCRPLRYQGAHAGNLEKNRGNIGISLTGKFVYGPTGQSPTRVQIQSLERFLRLLSDRYDIPPESIKTHNQFTDTVCPGPILEAEVAQIRHRMAAVASH